ncbi:MAG: hypothetical protein K2X32_08895 [Phycisphaerales bacterium]|nr:hypothetical protein [Phycisphaerales bacterium]
MHRFTWIILAAVVLAGEIPAVAQSPTQPPLTLDEISTLIRNSPPIEIRATRTFSTNVPAAEIERRWHEIANKPDHPERRDIERLRDLSHAKEATEIVMAFGGGLRYLAEKSSDSVGVVAAGDDSVRWMLGRFEYEPGVRTGQLTVIRAGVPFPMTSNVSQLLNEVSQQVVTLANGYIVTGSLSAVAGPGESYSDGDVDRFEVTRDSGGRIARVMRVSGVKPERLVWTAEFRYDESNPLLVLNLPLAKSVRIVEQSGVIAEWSNISAGPIAESTLRERIAIPEVEASTKVVDFGSSASTQIPEGPTIVWERGPDGDKFTVTGASASSVPALPVASRSGWGRWLAIALVAGLAASGFWLWARRRT